MLRAGVRAAIACTQEGSVESAALLGGNAPARFACGLSHDLRVPQDRAVTIVHAEVAAAARQILIDAEAAYRAGNQTDILLAMLRLSGMLNVFPLPSGSAEAELIAAGIQDHTSLELRKVCVCVEGGVLELILCVVMWRSAKRPA
jgi:hypothetical protein